MRISKQQLAAFLRLGMTSKDVEALCDINRPEAEAVSTFRSGEIASRRQVHQTITGKARPISLDLRDCCYRYVLTSCCRRCSPLALILHNYQQALTKQARGPISELCLLGSCGTPQELATFLLAMKVSLVLCPRVIELIGPNSAMLNLLSFCM